MNGQAVGLLIAALAFSDASRGINRLEVQQKAQQKKLAARKAAKVAKALPGLTGDAEHGFF